MRFMLEYPLLNDADGGAWLEPANIAEFARVAEAAGVDGIALTDHPAPSKKWLDRGGHETIDPFVGLGFMAAVTSRIKLMTYLTVVPYRNPLLLAKSMTAVDLLSGGRAVFALGTGYLKSEFAALGVDFDERNELFDEAVEVLRGLWTDESETGFQYDGRHFRSLGVALRPRQVQQPHPPLWLGGNAKIVRDRVAAWGQGWAPLGGGPNTRSTTRTVPIDSEQQFADMVTEIKAGMAANGRDPETLDVMSGGFSRPADSSPGALLDHYGHLAELGVTWTHANFDRSSVAAALDSLGTFGEEVIAKAR